MNNLELKPDEITMIIYHKKCPDGFGAAYSCWKYCKLGNNNKNIIYHASQHGDPVPDVTGHNVLICDFSFPYDITLQLIEKANKLAVIDHHKTAVENLKELDDKYKYIVMDHSGAYLTWQYFFPNMKVPKLIEYIEDHDIWKKSLYLTNEFSAWFHNSVPFEFEEYDKYFEDEILLNNIETNGVIMSKMSETLTNRAAENVTVKFMELGDNNYLVGYLNTSINKSEIGNKMVLNNPNIDFAVAYSINDYCNHTVFSLRSTNDHTDVSRIAKLFGGGGHRNASGVKVDYVTNTLPGRVFDNGNLYDKLNDLYHYFALGLNVASMNCTSHINKVAKYLLGTKYEGGKQRASILLSDKLNDDTIDIIDIWYHQIVDNKHQIVHHVYFNEETNIKNKLDKLKHVYKEQLNEWNEGDPMIIKNNDFYL